MSSPVRCIRRSIWVCFPQLQFASVWQSASAYGSVYDPTTRSDRIEHDVMVRTVLIGLGCSFIAGAQTQQLSAEYFETKVRPVFAAKCYACHSDKSGRAQGGLWLDSVQGIKQGGNSGPLIDTADPERSLLLRALRYQDKDLKMPPGKALPPETVAEIEVWVKAGAPLPED